MIFVDKMEKHGLDDSTVNLVKVPDPKNVTWMSRHHLIRRSLLYI